MMTNNQTGAASKAPLEPERHKLAYRQNKRLNKKAYWETHRHKGMVGLIGFGLGSAVGFYFTGDVFPWNSVGFVVGFALTALYQRNEH